MMSRSLIRFLVLNCAHVVRLIAIEPENCSNNNKLMKADDYKEMLRLYSS
jgi:hypothetical protein